MTAPRKPTPRAAGKGGKAVKAAVSLLPSSAKEYEMALVHQFAGMVAHKIIAIGGRMDSDTMGKIAHALDFRLNIVGVVDYRRVQSITPITPTPQRARKGKP